LASPIYFDLTELTTNPIRTGIQRVEREILRHWPGARPLVPCRFDGMQFIEFSDIVIDILTAEATPPGQAEKELIEPHLRKGRPISPNELKSALFNPELFFDHQRADAYCVLSRDPAAQITWLVYDFLPFLQPQFFRPGTSVSCMPYIHAMQQISRACFISAQTRSEFITRIMRHEWKAGPAFPLGGDGPGLPRHSFDHSKNTFVYIGTIEPRKNVADILLAFESLWEKLVDVRLTVIGRLEAGATREPAILERLRTEPRFKYLGQASDGQVREVMQSARATLFVSAAEGFGIPPYESLAAGVPVIASAGLPSLDLLPVGGRIIIDEITPKAISDAVTRMLDDTAAKRLWKEASNLEVPTWRGFVQSLAAWLLEPVMFGAVAGPASGHSPECSAGTVFAGRSDATR
jgi:glycosyltransferase involved in cell wall biosynthesis